MTTFKRHFFVREQYLGFTRLGYGWTHSERTPPTGAGFFCPICSELWANCPVEGQISIMMWRACDHHKYGDPPHGTWSAGRIHRDDVPGSLWLDHDPQWNETMPPAVLAREVLLHLQWAGSTFAEPVASMCRDMVRLLNTAKS